MKRQIIERYGYIETALFWEKGLTANALAEIFDISRQAAQKNIDDYRNAYPMQMKYDSSLKKHVAGEHFEPEFIKTDPLLFLDYLRGQKMAGYYHEDQDWSDIEVTDVNRLMRPRLHLNYIKLLLSALQNQQTVIIDYRQKDLEPETDTNRIISPNHLVFADNRYHLRSYCHERHYHLDFVLSRVIYAEPAYEEWVSSREDTDWNTFVELSFTPNPELPESVQAAVIRHYADDSNGVWNIKCRKALAFYIERQLAKRADDKYKMPLWCLEKVVKVFT